MIDLAKTLTAAVLVAVGGACTGSVPPAWEALDASDWRVTEVFEDGSVRLEYIPSGATIGACMTDALCDDTAPTFHFTEE